jgi:TonB-dependent receptor
MRPFRFASALIFTLISQSALPRLAAAQAAAAADDAVEDEVEGAEAEDAPAEKPAEKPAEAETAKPAPAAEAEAEEVTGAEEQEMSDAELDAEAEAELAAEEAEGAAALTRPPAKGKGALVGVVKDAVEHDTAPEAQISVVGTKYKTIADFDGRYRLELPPGTYTLRIYVELHKPSVVKGVEVKAGAVDRIDVDVIPDEQAVETVEIVTEVDKSSVEGLLLTRQRSAAVGDGVGRAEIARTPASNAAQATQRVVGATIVGNRFVYVRGLGERYTNSLLNGAPLPSPEPDRAAIPLDLFPSLILENITIVKTFTPDMPTDFAGGSVRIDTRELPSKPLFQLSLGTGFDTKATFRDRYTQPSSKTDWLGFDHSMRPLPDGFPDHVLTADDDAIAAGKQINSSMHPRTAFTPPNYSLSTVAGNGWKLPNDQRLGMLGTFNYGRSFRNRKAHRTDFQPEAEPGTGQPVIGIENDIDSEQGEDKVNWGALGTVSYWPAQKHRLSVTGIHTQLADATTNFSTGTYENLNGTVKSAQLRYVSRALNMLQLRGEHDFSKLNKAQLSWNASYSVATRNEPDSRTTAYQFNEVRDSWSANTNGSSGEHQYIEQGEKQRGAGLDWTQPFTSNPDVGKLKLGGLFSQRDRDYQARRFIFNRVRRPEDPSLFECGPVYYLECPDKLYRNENIGPNLTLQETTFPDDAYKATLDIYAGYAMVDLTFWDDLRVIAGARVEHTSQTIDPYSQYLVTEGDGGASEGADIDATDVLPSVSFAYSLTKKSKLRAVASETLARPQIRELSPAEYTDYFGGDTNKGNPNLRLTYIKNFDLRFETFPTPREVLAFSIFYKIFKDPIEPYVQANNIVSYQNAKGARLVGLELEARKSLVFITPALRDLSVIGNLTLAYSQIELDPETGVAGIIVTNKDRAMVNQAPYVVNLALDYANEPLGLDMRLLGNVIGKHITKVGTAGLDDEYEQPRLMMDATIAKDLGKHFTVKFNANNIIGAPWVFTLGKKKDPEKETYREYEGRVFQLSATYTY